jgi:hypothetical protein
MATPKLFTSSVAFTDPAGNPLAFGSIQLDLQGPQVLIGGGIVDSETIFIGLDGSGLVMDAQSAFFNDQFINSNSVYHGYQVVLRSSGGRTCTGGWTQRNPQTVGPGMSQLGQWNFAGGSPLDLSFMQSSVIPGVQIVIQPFQRVVVPYSATAVFAAASSLITAFEILLSGGVTAPTLTGLSPCLLIFAITEDGAGGHPFVWPTNVKNPQSIDTAPGAKNVQAFYYDGTNAWPVAMATDN